MCNGLYNVIGSIVNVIFATNFSIKSSFVSGFLELDWYVLWFFVIFQSNTTFLCVSLIIFAGHYDRDSKMCSSWKPEKKEVWGIRNVSMRKSQETNKNFVNLSYSLITVLTSKAPMLYKLLLEAQNWIT